MMGKGREREREMDPELGIIIELLVLTETPKVRALQESEGSLDKVRRVRK